MEAGEGDVTLETKTLIHPELTQTIRHYYSVEAQFDTSSRLKHVTQPKHQKAVFIAFGVLYYLLLLNFNHSSS